MRVLALILVVAWGLAACDGERPPMPKTGDGAQGQTEPAPKTSTPER